MSSQQEQPTTAAEPATAAPAAEPAATVPATEPGWFDNLVQLSQRLMSPTASELPAAPAPAPTEATSSSSSSDSHVESPAMANTAHESSESEKGALEPALGIREDSCPVCMEDLTDPKPWPANCRHSFCSSCSEACLRRSLRCPICRAEAPESAKPGPSRQEVLLTTAMLIRLRELDRLREEYAAAEQQRPQRVATTRVGRWVSRKANAINQFMDSIID